MKLVPRPPKHFYEKQFSAEKRTHKKGARNKKTFYCGEALTGTTTEYKDSDENNPKSIHRGFNEKHFSFGFRALLRQKPIIEWFYFSRFLFAHSRLLFFSAPLRRLPRDPQFNFFFYFIFFSLDSSSDTKGKLLILTIFTFSFSSSSSRRR